MKKRFKLTSKQLSILLVLIVYLVVEVLINTGNISRLVKSLLVPVSCYIVAALALNLLVGFSGELSLGQAGFMSIGAFSATCVSSALENTVTNPILRLIIAIVVASIVASIFGFIIGIPVLKLEGDYLAIVTLAFCQIIKNIINNIYLGYDSNGIQFCFVDNKLNLLSDGRILLNGPMGATGNTKLSSFTAGIILIIITLIIIYNLMDCKIGRAIKACRDNRIAAHSIGINSTKVKMTAFVIAAAITGAAGALYALNYSSISASKFDYNSSILILVYVVLGGLGNINGTIISTTLLYVLPEALRGFSDYRMLIYAILLISIMLITNNKYTKEFVSKIKNYKKGEENEH